jgi:hypothetical protein
MSPRSLVALALVFAFVVSPARAQDQNLWRSFAQKLPPGAFVVVRLSNGSTLKGHLVQVTSDTITVLPKTRLPVPARALAFVDVESIVNPKEGLSPGAKVLATAGAAGGIVFGIFLALVAASGGWD